MRDARGRFLPGPDPARHALTTAERRRGYRNALKADLPASVLRWLLSRLRTYYRQRGCYRRPRTKGRTAG